MLRVRAMAAEEEGTIARWAHSRTEPARRVERARIIALARAGRAVPSIAAELRCSPGTVRLWLKRFNAQGLAGLEDAPRSGHPPRYTREQGSEVIATALTRPDTLDLPFGSWTLDRLQVYLNEERGIPIKRSRIDELLLAEGLPWRSQETWFGERAALEPGAQVPQDQQPLDPVFAQKRGPSSPSTRHRRRAV